MLQWARYRIVHRSMAGREGKRAGIKTVVDGIKFPSKLEAARYVYLRDLQAEGEISHLTLQPSFLLLPSFFIYGKTIRKAEYIADFQYVYNETVYVEDTKAKFFQDPVYKLKKKLFLYEHMRLTPETLFFEVYNPYEHPSRLGTEASAPRRRKRKNRRTDTGT